MDPLTIAAIGMGLGQSIFGMVKKSRAVARAGRNVRPIRTTQQGITDNLDLAENLASQGLSTGAKNAYITNSERGLTSSIDAILRSGTSVNGVGELEENFNSGITRLSLAEDNARMNNLNTYMKANYANAEDQDLNWQVNEYAPWADRAQQNAQESAQAMSDISGGLNTALSSWASYEQGKDNPDAGLAKPNNTRGGRVTVGPMQGSFGSTAAMGTRMISPNPINVPYSNRSLQVLNGLGLMPLNTSGVDWNG